MNKLYPWQNEPWQRWASLRSRLPHAILLKGAQGNSDTVVMSSTKAIGVYREQKPTGSAGLKASSTKGD